jgi:hypothetical protein
VCGLHITTYRALIPFGFWDRITEDDEPRTAFFYPMYAEENRE